MVIEGKLNCSDANKKKTIKKKKKERKYRINSDNSQDFHIPFI